MDQPTQPGFYLYTAKIYGTTPAVVYGTPPVLGSRTPFAYGNGPVTQLPGTWEPWIDPAVLASAEGRIRELEAENARLDDLNRQWAEASKESLARYLTLERNAQDGYYRDQRRIEELTSESARRERDIESLKGAMQEIANARDDFRAKADAFSDQSHRIKALEGEVVRCKGGE